MVELILFLLAAIGMCHIMVDGSILNPFKKWLEKPTWMLSWSKGKLLAMLSCYQCSGFWAGALIGLLMWYTGCDPLHVKNLSILFCYACAGSYIGTKAAVLMMKLQESE
jgi:hypothetical protein